MALISQMSGRNFFDETEEGEEPDVDDGIRLKRAVPEHPQFKEAKAPSIIDSQQHVSRQIIDNTPASPTPRPYDPEREQDEREDEQAVEIERVIEEGTRRLEREENRRRRGHTDAGDKEFPCYMCKMNPVEHFGDICESCQYSLEYDNAPPKRNPPDKEDYLLEAGHYDLERYKADHDAWEKLVAEYSAYLKAYSEYASDKATYDANLGIYTALEQAESDIDSAAASYSLAANYATMYSEAAAADAGWDANKSAVLTYLGNVDTENADASYSANLATYIIGIGYLTRPDIDSWADTCCSCGYDIAAWRAEVVAFAATMPDHSAAEPTDEPVPPQAVEIPTQEPNKEDYWVEPRYDEALYRYAMAEYEGKI